MVKIGVISDTHIPERAKTIPNKVLDSLKEMDLILHAGDLVEMKVLEILKSICKNVKAVYGNMDSSEVIKNLPQKELISVEGLCIGLFHGWGAPWGLIQLLNRVFKDDNPDIIIFGHSHQPFNKKEKDILYFNPGSPTDKIFSLYNSYGILEIDNNSIKRAEIIKI
ncbi:MAG: metallophosphoesterase [Candidatus Omnitrophica bacterium]|nr:metallophosphoesterase [Candidatus Omnitrophota bacterium]